MENYTNNLEKRMYFLVPYQLSGIQQAIQAGHAALEYAREYKNDKQFINFVDNWKTWIILNGGTSRDGANDEERGTLNSIEKNLEENEIKYTIFRETDLNNTLTAICFICDERIFNYKDYPSWKRYIIDEMIGSNPDILIQTEEELKERFPKLYKKWLKKIGGEKNAFLKNLLKDKELA